MCLSVLLWGANKIGYFGVNTVPFHPKRCQPLDLTDGAKYKKERRKEWKREREKERKDKLQWNAKTADLALFP